MNYFSIRYPMKNILLLIPLVIFFEDVTAQEIKVVRQEKTSSGKKSNTFEFLEAGVDTTSLIFVATLEVTSGENPFIETMYKKIATRAKQLGANAYILRGFKPDHTSITFDVYQASENTLQLNESLEPKNIVYIFAGEKNEKTEYYSFEFNGTVKSLKNGTYFRHSLKEGEQVKLKKGTVAGTTMWIKWKKSQPSSYYSIYGFAHQPVVKRTTNSQAFKPGKFMPVDKNLARLLTVMLDQTSP